MFRFFVWVHRICMRVKKNYCIAETFFDASSAYYMCIFLFLPVTVMLIVFSSFPHAVPKRALQRDKYGSQTKHCLSNVIDFGFAFFSLDADKGVMKTTSFPLEAIQFSL